MALHQPKPGNSSLPRRTHRRVHTSAFLKDIFSFRGSTAAKQETSYPPDVLAKPFQQWLLEHGGQSAALGLTKVQLCQCGGQGRGLVAVQDIRKGERVLQVPGSLIITADGALSASSLAPHGLTQLGEYTVMAAYLAELRYWATVGSSAAEQAASSPSPSRPAQAEASRLHTYLAMLPDKTGGVLEWPETCVQALPAASHVRQQAVRMRDAAKLTWAEVQPIMQRAEQAGAIPASALTQKSLQWALSTMLARAVRLTARGGQLALVPWADFLNHSPSSTAHLDWEPSPGEGPGAGGVALVADRAYRSGEQIFISYGQRSSAELLLSYGFCPDPPSHPHETLPLVIGLQPGDPLKEVKAAALAEHALPTSCPFPLRIDALPAGLISYAAFCAAGVTQPGGTGRASNKRAQQTPTADSIPDVRSLLLKVLPGAAQGASGGVTPGGASGPSEQWHRTQPPKQRGSVGDDEGGAARVAACAQQAALPPDLEAAGLRYVASTCAALLKATSPPPTVSPGTEGQQTLDSMLAAIVGHERRILARTEFMCSSQARALTKVT